MENKEYKIVITPTSQGYLWFSNSETPVVYDDGTSKEIILKDTDNPFVVEGQLYDSAAKKSCSIKYVDGHYLVNYFQVSDEDMASPTHEVKVYHSNRMEGRILHFLRYWEASPDDNCLGMDVLKMTKNVFIGFNPQK